MFKEFMNWLGSKDERRLTVLLALLGPLMMVVTDGNIMVCITFLVLWIVNLIAPDSWFGIENKQQPKKD